MRLYGIADYDDNDEPMIVHIFTSLENIPEGATIYYSDKEDASIYDFEEWKVYNGNLEEIWDAIKIGDKYIDWDTLCAEDLPVKYTKTITSIDWDKLDECPRGVVYGVYKEGKKIDTKFVEE